MTVDCCGHKRMFKRAGWLYLQPSWQRGAKIHTRRLSELKSCLLITKLQARVLRLLFPIQNQSFRRNVRLAASPTTYAF